MTDLDWFCLLWVAAAVAYLSIFFQERVRVEREPEEADGVGYARTLHQPVGDGSPAGITNGGE